MGFATLLVERLAPNVLLVRRQDEPAPAASESLRAGVSVLVSAAAGRAPAEVAGVLTDLALEEYLLVPAAGVATHAWLAEVALRTGRDIVFGTGWSAYHPFPAVLTQPERGGDQRVLDIAPAPPGWTRDENHGYRAENGVLAEVVPSGLVVRGPDGPPADGVLPFNPAGWTLYLGVPGEPVGLPVVVAAEGLLDWLGPTRRTTTKARILGELDPEAREALARSVRKFRPSAKPQPTPKPRLTQKPELTPKPTPIPRPAPAPKAVPVSQPESVPEPLPQPVSAPAPAPVPSFSTSMPSIATMSSAPVSTVSNGTASEPRREPSPEPVREPEPVLAKEPEPVPEPEPAQEPEESPATAQPVPLAQPGPGPLSIPDRVSTAAEQTRFAAAAGEAFGEALASVNTALATWPSLRQGANAGFKADLVAVCLYLSRDQATQVNAAVRDGIPTPVDAHIPCLASGIRRLPTHRRAVLRQSVLPDAPGGAPGTLLTEPGFLTASMDLDITVPGAEVDVLIWPASARRTAELMVGRPVNEAVFVAGARFKTLAVRTTDGGDGDVEGPAAPRVAALFRELAPSEQPSGAELDERDQAVLAKLDRILATRQQRTLRLVDDPDLVSRLTSSMVEWQAAHTTAAAS